MSDVHGADAGADETFATLGLALDRRLLKAIMKCGFVRPTVVQRRTLPLALEGKDLLVRARTGSGKTLAYLIPLVQKVLSSKLQASEIQTSASGSVASRDAIRAVVLVPTRELVAQVHAQLDALLYFCRDDVRCVALSAEKTSVQETWLRGKPDIVISTPGRLAALLDKAKTSGAYGLKSTVETVVVDEADLIFSFGYADDVSTIVSQLPNTCQSFLMSATLNADVQALKKLVLHNAVTVKVQEAPTDGALAQWFVEAKEKDRDVLLFALLRLELISGKKLFFVNSINSCYRIKLLLEQFHIKAAVLNAELPMNTRLHILQEFNKGVFDNLICTDDSMVVPESYEGEFDSDDEEDEDEDMEEDSEDDEDEDDEDEEDEDDEDEGENKKKSKKTKETSDEEDEEEDEEDDEEDEDEDEEDEDEEQTNQEQTKQDNGKNNKRKRQRNEVEADDEFGVARGVDFKGVSVVVNIDMPASLEAYTHRIGRTARGGAGGMALTIVNADSEEEHDLLEEIQASQPAIDDQPQPAPLALDIREINNFRYRVEDVARAVTKKAIQEARVREVKREMLNSEKLRSHFEDNPMERALLKHDAFRTSKVQTHLKHIPDYLLPTVMRSGAGGGQTLQPGQINGGAGPKTVVAEFGRSTAGRRKWKEKKKVGEYRSHNSKKARAMRSKNFGKVREARGRMRYTDNSNPLF